MPAPDGPQFRFHLYHGTSASNIEQILKNGLGSVGDLRGDVRGSEKYSFLTHDPELAEYYANNYEDPAVITVAVRPRDLSVDWNSFDEPVHAYDGEPKRNFDSSKLRHGTKDWANSLRQTGAVFHSGNISPEHIVNIEKW